MDEQLEPRPLLHPPGKSPMFASLRTAACVLSFTLASLS